MARTRARGACRWLAPLCLALGPGCEVVLDVRVDAPLDPRLATSAGLQIRRAARPAADDPRTTPAAVAPAAPTE